MNRAQNHAILLDEAKAHLRIEGSDDEAMLSTYIESAEICLEEHLNRALTDRGWRLLLDRWPAGAVRLPRPPLKTVESVVVTDRQGGAQTVDPATYQVDTRPEPGLLIPAADTSLPRPGRKDGGIEINFTAGYGPDWNQVPAPLRQAILMLVAHFYDHRQLGDGSVLPSAVWELAAPYRVLAL